MKLPRDISAQELIKSLQKLGYVVTRQKGSHIRLTTTSSGQHHLTIPNHNTLKLGTLSSIIGDIAAHFKQTKEEIAEKLFG
jgi:predicted RNA binding protein YcfA (HicA-like mRNA interferase family)